MESCLHNFCTLVKQGSDILHTIFTAVIFCWHVLHEYFFERHGLIKLRCSDYPIIIILIIKKCLAPQNTLAPLTYPGVCVCAGVCICGEPFVYCSHVYICTVGSGALAWSVQQSSHLNKDKWIITQISLILSSVGLMLSLPVLSKHSSLLERENSA